MIVKYFRMVSSFIKLSHGQKMSCDGAFQGGVMEIQIYVNAYLYNFKLKI
jgi:hypothetical protein